MPGTNKSSDFTRGTIDSAIGPPLIGALLRMPWEQVRRRIVAHLHASGFDDIEPPHLNVLQFPSPDGVRPSELAARLRVSKQAVNYLLGELERRGYVRREAHPGDPRAKLIRLTERGHRAEQTIQAAVREVEREWAERIGKRRFEQLRATLVELGREGEAAES